MKIEMYVSNRFLLDKLIKLVADTELMIAEVKELDRVVGKNTNLSDIELRIAGLRNEIEQLESDGVSDERYKFSYVSSD